MPFMTVVEGPVYQSREHVAASDFLTVHVYDGLNSAS